MELNPNAASILFPSDAPKTERPATAVQQPVTPPVSTNPPAHASDEIAAKIFGETSKPEYSGILDSELSSYVVDAVKAGDQAQADALRHAERSLASDFSSAGTDPQDLQQAFEVVRQSRQSFNEPTPEEAQASFFKGMSDVQQAGISNDDLNAARALIRDLDKKSPGVIASLNAHGAGNDMTLIMAAIKEARRRGY